MENIKFSLIIPTYNVEKYIEKCIRSIIEQNYDNYEIIIVNDGSTDKSIDVINKINNKKIQIFNKKNGGLSSARNYGLTKATGDYIWFIDGDDYIEPGSLKKLNNIIQKEKYDCICFEYNIVKNDVKIPEIDKKNNYNEKDFPLIAVSACTKIFNRKFFVNNSFKFYEGILFEDLELIPYVLCISKNIYFLEEQLYNYVQRNGSIMNSLSEFKKNRDDKFIALDNLIKKFKNAQIYDEYSSELEYLVIKHLILVYTSEILLYNKKIYYNRCLNVLDYLNNLNAKWYENYYYKTSSAKSRIYIFLFRKKMFLGCKVISKIKKKLEI